MQESDLTRRQALRAATAAAVGGAAVAATAQGTAPKRALRFDDPIWNREVKARMDGSVDPKKFIYGSVTGTVCGVRVEQVEDPLMQKIRYLDKLIDELAKGKKLASILRG